MQHSQSILRTYCYDGFITVSEILKKQHKIHNANKLS